MLVPLLRITKNSTATSAGGHGCVLMALNVAIGDVTLPKYWITTDGLWWSCSRKIQCLLKPEIFFKVCFDSILGSNHYDQVFHLHGTPSRYLPLLRDRGQCLHKQGWPAHWRMSGISEPYTLKANSVLRSLYRQPEPVLQRRPTEGASTHPPGWDLDHLGSSLDHWPQALEQITQLSDTSLSPSMKVGTRTVLSPQGCEDQMAYYL